MNRLLSFVLLTLSCIFAASRSSAQETHRLSVFILDTTRLGPSSEFPLLGGVSAIEWMPGKSLFPQSSSKSALLLFSDHTPNKPTEGVTPRTLVFDYDIKSKDLKRIVRPFDSNSKQVINAVEAVRYAPALSSVFYSYEADSKPWRTGIVRLNKDKQPDSILSIVIPRKMENRGIEAMCIGRDNNLWYCMESGAEEDQQSLAFVCIPYNKATKRHDTNRKMEYRYPFDKCSCLGDSLCNRFNRNLGNGISEMIAMPKELGDGFLILERCFNGNFCTVRLYHADIAAQGVMSKTLVFDFNATGLKPDNLEGMAWGPKEQGRNVLYLVSDDNYNYRSKNPQRTQLIRLLVGR